MKTIVFLAYMGSGKDVAINYVKDKYNIPIAISFTTRPIRTGEKNGREYHFVSKEEFSGLKFPIPYREYETIDSNGNQDIWYYGTNPDIEGKIVILDKIGTELLCDYLGRDNVKIIYIKVDDKIRRERLQGRGDNPLEVGRRIANDMMVFAGSEEFADCVIENNGTLEEFYKKIDEIMKGGER